MKNVDLSTLFIIATILMKIRARQGNTFSELMTITFSVSCKIHFDYGSYRGWNNFYPHIEVKAIFFVLDNDLWLFFGIWFEGIKKSKWSYRSWIKCPLGIKMSLHYFLLPYHLIALVLLQQELFYRYKKKWKICIQVWQRSFVNIVTYLKLWV